MDTSAKRPRRPKPIFSPEEQARRDALREAQREARRRDRAARAALPPELLAFERRVNQRLSALLPDINRMMEERKK